MPDFKVKLLRNTVLFFDLDGTLVDTDYANFLSYRDAFKFCKEPESNLIYNPRKRLNRTSLKEQFPYLTENRLARIILKKEECFNNYLRETKPKIEIINILCKYANTNQTVLVTNCRENRALNILRYYCLTDKFSHFFFRHINENNKIVNKFQNAISSLCISPESVFAFENEEKEISDAIKAGIQVINPLNI